MINETKISQINYQKLLGLFPASWHDRLKIYTAEELFCVYKLCVFKPKKDLDSEPCQDHDAKYCSKCAMLKTGDVTYAAIRVKILRYLKGTLDEWSRPCRPVPPQAFAKLGRRFKYAFEDEIASLPQLDSTTTEELSKLSDKINRNRVA